MQHTSVEDHSIEAHTGHIVVELHDGRESSHVIIPDQASSNAKPFGVVVHVGAGIEDIKIGDKIIFVPNAMLIGIEHRGRKLVFAKKEFVLGKYVRDIVPFVTKTLTETGATIDCQ